MTDEQLERGKKLKTQIDKLKSKIGYWEKATCITEIHVQYPCTYPAENRTFIDNGSYVNFEVLKTLTLQAMNKKLEELEKEYREL